MDLNTRLAEAMARQLMELSRKFPDAKPPREELEAAVTAAIDEFEAEIKRQARQILPRCDEAIGAVIRMQSGPWRQEEIAAQVLELFPNIVDDLADTPERKLRLMKTITAEYVKGTTLTDAQIDAVMEKYPDVFELMEKDRTMTFGDAMIKLGHSRPEPKH